MGTERSDRILLAASGSVSVVGLPNWAVLMRTQGWEIRVCLTPAAAEFVTRRAVAATTGSPPVGPSWSDVPFDFTFQQISEWADVVVVIPATANTIAKLASGACDNLMLSVVTGSPAPTLVVPAVPPAMFDRPAVRRNMDTLAADGFEIVPPEPALSLQSGRIEKGIPNIMKIVERIRKILVDLPDRG